MSTHVIRRPSWVSDRLVAERGENAGFQMYTREGNDACARMVLLIVDTIEKNSTPPRNIPPLLKDLTTSLARVHGEVYDTEPRGAILDALNEYLVPNGYAALDEFPW